MSNVFDEYSVNGVGPYTISFEYQAQEDVVVLYHDPETKEYTVQPNTAWSFENATSIKLTEAPGVDVDKVRIQRVTPVNPLRALFYPGSAIRAQDLNANFEQLQMAIEEGRSNLSDLKIYLDFKDEELQQEIDDLREHSDEEDQKLQDQIEDLKDYTDLNFWNKNEDTITKDDQIFGVVKTKVDDKHIFNAEAIAARHDAFVQDLTPPAVIYEQPGKIWNDTELIKDYFWDEENETWISFVKSGAQGAKGEKGDRGEPGEVEEAPLGGELYVRSDGAWVQFEPPTGGLVYQGVWSDNSNTPTDPEAGYFWVWDGADNSILTGVAWGTGQNDVINQNDRLYYDGTNFEVVSVGSSVGGVQSISVTAPLTTNGDAENPVISISPATTSSAGSMSSADKTKLDSLGVVAAQNLSYTTGTATGVVVIDGGGTNATIPAATTTLAGLMTAADKLKLDNLEGGGSGDGEILTFVAPLVKTGTTVSFDLQSLSNAR